MELRTSPLAQDNLGIAITHMDKPTHSLTIPFCKRPDVLTHRTATNFQTTTHLNITQDFARKQVHGTTNKSNCTA